jgi:diguanylate cyclase (GGDEF)-like protein
MGLLTRIRPEKLTTADSIAKNDSSDVRHSPVSPCEDGKSFSPPTLVPRRRHLEESLNELLSSAILAQDKNLDWILQTMDSIADNPKSEKPDRKTFSDELKRASVTAVKQSLIERELRSLALTDDLTGLYNRRAFLAVSTQLLKVAARKSQSVLLFVADLDHLKEINDTFGHREGDFALIRTSDALEEAFRHSDVIGRLGGDEFAIMVLEAASRDQSAILQRLERCIAQASKDESRYKLSLSVGVARFDPQNPLSLGDLLDKADQAMYKNKKIGLPPLDRQINQP